MSILIKYRSLALKPKEKKIELPDHAYDIHTEPRGWYSNNGVWLWWKEYGISKCKKMISSTHIKKIPFEIINQSVTQ